MSIRRVKHNGYLVVSALVTDGWHEWYEDRTYIGYGRGEVKRMFQAHVRACGWQVVA